MLKISHLTIKYDKEILNDVEFLAYRGFVHLIRGESGSGKTTLLYRLGLISDQKDYEYTIDDINAIKNDNMRRSNIAFLLQNAMLVEEYSVAENIIFSAQLVDKSITDADILNILDEVDLKVPLNQDIQTLSGGERQRLAIACALIKDTDIIILDEPTSSLDKGHEKEIFELLKEIAHHKNKCVIISSHSQEAIQYSDIICEIKDKRLVLIKSFTFFY
jgi:ABC-type lipoprotein export system ATPase subunit